MSERLGLFGGTFDPPHLGHLALAEWARERLRLDRVVFVPAGDPPHKRGRVVTRAAVRLAMTERAIEGREGFALSRIEIDREGPSYTVDTLRALRDAHPGSRWWFLIGEDSLAELSTWKEPETVVRLATPAVAVRPGSRVRRQPRVFGRPVVWLDNPPIDVSSSGVRARARRGASIRFLVPDAVERFVVASRLYRGAAGRAVAAARTPAPARPRSDRRVSYDPRAFWEQRLSEQFDLRGTGETGLSLAYNRACYELRRVVLDRALREAGRDPRGRTVLDVGCGTGFFTRYYLERGCAHLTGVDIAPTSIERLSQRHPEARFLLADIGADPIDGTFDLVNAFDVLYHITDDARWEKAVGHLARAVASQGMLLLTDTFADLPRLAEHNVMRPLSRYRDLLGAAGLEVQSLYPTHVLLNRELGPFRPLNRLPGLLYAADRVLLGLGFGHGPAVSKLLVAKRKR